MVFPDGIVPIPVGDQQEIVVLDVHSSQLYANDDVTMYAFDDNSNHLILGNDVWLQTGLPTAPSLSTEEECDVDKAMADIYNTMMQLKASDAADEEAPGISMPILDV